MVRTPGPWVLLSCFDLFWVSHPVLVPRGYSRLYSRDHSLWGLEILPGYQTWVSSARQTPSLLSHLSTHCGCVLSEAVLSCGISDLGDVMYRFRCLAGEPAAMLRRLVPLRPEPSKNLTPRRHLPMSERPAQPVRSPVQPAFPEGHPTPHFFGPLTEAFTVCEATCSSYCCLTYLVPYT